MSRSIILSFLLLLASLPAVASDSPSQKHDWLTGTWVLCEDPDGSPKDSLQFNPDGTGTVIRAKGNIEFLHKHSGLAVSLLANANGNAIPIELTASPSHDKLQLHSDQTGNTSIYVRSESQEAATCSVK
ncbi:hypothetical protein ACFONC_14255 [Luteimonas soli]|uniref:Uncharacterized protein n=1 Tax=Luteimonas soli TaxID=1648966 RepID=A0ABV7XMF0_9GAMM